MGLSNNHPSQSTNGIKKAVAFAERRPFQFRRSTSKSARRMLLNRSYVLTAQDIAGRFPRPWRLASFSESFLGGRFCLLPGQFLVGQSPTDNLFHRSNESLAVIRILAVVVPEGLLVYVAEQMERFNGNIGAAQTALQ